MYSSFKGVRKVSPYSFIKAALLCFNFGWNGYSVEMNEKSKSIKISSVKVGQRKAEAKVTVLSPKAVAAGWEIARDPKEAEAFLIRAGIIIKAGKLAPEYE
jgi:hypothetical protein